MDWIFPEQQNYNLIDWIKKNRNIADERKFFNPVYEDLHDPFLIHGINDAVKIISKAVKEKQKIYIHGDFDVDGITATSIMWSFLYKDLGASTLPYIPNRFTEGYGLSEETIQKIIDDGGNLIISVDCGVKDIELVDKYADKIDFVITDHHNIRLAEKKIPKEAKKVGEYIIAKKAKAVVHPTLNGSYPFKEICGAVVSWKLCSALNDYMGIGINMQKYLDLAALGTVCDVMPLVDENRTIVKLGIEQMRKTEHIGLKTLLNAAQIDLGSLDAYHLGFIIGPRLNASGRLENAIDGVRLLTTNSLNFANEITAKLNDLNKQRQDLTKQYLEIAEKDILLLDKNNKIHFIYGDEWPEGIIGLIAGKLTEKYNKPVIVGSKKGNIIKASARSIDGFHVADALKTLDPHLMRHGGHALAAGLTLEESNVEKFKEGIINLANQAFDGKDLSKKVKIDAMATIDEINTNNATTLLSFSPFGMHNSKPLIALRGLNVNDFKYIGKDQAHVKFIPKDCNFECLGFSMVEQFSKINKDSFDIAGHIDIDTWKGNRKVVFKVAHVR